LNKSEEAIKAYDKAIEINPEYLEAWNNKGVALSKINKSEEAIKAYDKEIEIDQNNSLAWYNRACIYSLINNKDKAICDLKEAVELDRSLKESAKKDNDFKRLWTNEHFKEITK
jgi:tetratricopeptide (TPR) repeat protein